ncbi:MAG: CorA-like Mg2+ transporter protein [Microgenomates bacterium OLB23]|nr:MAG: CorA-like Mg2+ transporter protein [Microgenomates bacterium OLB23]
MQDPSTEELIELASSFHLEVDLLLDGIDPYEVPRLEVVGKNTYIFTRFPQELKDQTITMPVLFVVSERFIATICIGDAPFLEVFSKNEKNHLLQHKQTKPFLNFYSK